MNSSGPAHPQFKSPLYVTNSNPNAFKGGGGGNYISAPSHHHDTDSPGKKNIPLVVDGITPAMNSMSATKLEKYNREEIKRKHQQQHSNAIANSGISVINGGKIALVHDSNSPDNDANKYLITE